MIRHKRYVKFAVYIAVVVLVNLVAASLFFRIDLTKNKVYSLSKVSRSVVSTLKEPLTINVFFTSNLPAPYNTTEQYLKDILGEYALNANKNFNYRFYDVSAEGEIDAAKTDENRKLASNYGINPVQIQVVEKDEMKFKKAYMGLVIIHGDMVERIPTITSTEGLEYKLTTTIQKLNNKISSLLGLKDKIKVRLYLSQSINSIAPSMGINDLSKIPADIKKVVEDLNSRMYGKIDYSFYEPSNETEVDKISKSFNVMMLKWPSMEDGKIPGGSGLIGLTAEYNGKSMTFPVMQAFNVPLFGTQYKLADLRVLQDALEQGIESLIGINENLGYLTDKGTMQLYGSQRSEASMNSFNSLVSNSYSIKEISFSKGIPEGLNCMLIVRPTEQFSDYDLFQIDQALMKGTNLAVFLDSFKEIAPQSASPYMQQQSQVVPINTGLEKLFEHYGVKVNQSIVMDENCFKQRLPEQYGGGEQKIYFAPLIESSQINSDLDFMKNLKELITYKISPLSLVDNQIKNNELKALRLLSSSEKSWEMKDQIVFNPMFIRPPDGGEGMSSRPLAYIVEGSFPSYFAGKQIPVKPVEELQKNKEEDNGEIKPLIENKIKSKADFVAKSKPAKIFVIGSSEMLTDNLISEQGESPNSIFVMNVIDVLNGKNDTALMRSKIQSFNPLEVKDEGVKITAKVFNIIGLPVIVVIFGLLVWVRRISRRKSIEAAFRG